jgi:DNA-binding NarL/FixJ family response regulator
VVVADDVGDVRELVSIVLEETGHFRVVGRAGSAAEAVEVTARERPDLLLLDVAMPGRSGLDVLPELAARAPATRVIVMSTFTRAQVAHRALAGGAVGFVEKRLAPAAFVDDVVALAGVIDTATEAVDLVRTKLGLDASSSRSARGFVREALDRWECAEALDTVALLVSELVNNAVVHARSEPDLAVWLTPSRVRVEVTDASPLLPEVRSADLLDGSGRGLALVDALAASWGVEGRPDGKTVWFEVDRPGR